jgi:hypothetical protein
MLAGSKSDPVFAIDPATGDYYEYETGAEAQERAKAMAAAGDGQKWRVKRITDTRWKSREARKFEDGTYHHLPWIHRSWWDACRGVHMHHFPHVSRKEPGMIAYTESADKGMDNIQTQIKPGRYLEKYFADTLKYYGENIKRLAQEYERDHKPRKVHFAATPDDIQWVYETGPDSCMSSQRYREAHGYGYPTPGRWPNDTHACRMYAAGDLQVAYITDDDEPKGQVFARALVWPEKMTHSRCYGRNEMVMRENLLRLGYKAGAPHGAKLVRMPVEDTKLFVVPYVDIGQATGEGSMAVLDKKDHLILTPYVQGSYPANNTSGLCGMRLGRDLRPLMSSVTECQVCDTHTDDCGDLVPVYRNSSGGDYSMWCQMCLEAEGFDDEDNAAGAFECHYDGRWYSRRHVRQHKMFDGAIWSDRAFRANGFTCAATNVKYPVHHRVRMYDGALWCISHFEQNGFTCSWSGDHYPNNMKIQLVRDRAMSAQAFAIHGFTCAYCGQNESRANMSGGVKCVVCFNADSNIAYRLRGYRVSTQHMNEEYVTNG